MQDEKIELQEDARSDDEIREEYLEQQKQRILKDLEEHDQKDLSVCFDEQEPIDFAAEIEELETGQLAQLSLSLDDDQLADLLEDSDDRLRQRIAYALDDHRLLIAFSYMQKDDIVDMLGDFPVGRRKNVINLMKADDQRTINKLLQYPEDSAGGIMTTSYISLREDLTVQDGLAKIREIGPKTEVIETIYVIDRQRALIGYCDLRDLLSAPKRTKLSELTHYNVFYVEPEDDQYEAAKLVSRYDLQSIPVVSRKKQILGIITVDDVIDVIVEEYDEDMLQMAGVSKEESIDTTVGESVRLRLPWLFINLATAFLASFTVKIFEGTISKVVALSAVMTIVSGMGGNAGTQTMSILVRQLAQGKIKSSKAWKAFWKELLLGLIDGSATGALTGCIVAAVYGNYFLGIIVFVAMIGNLVVSGIFGFLVPLLLDRFHADPAVASSIFVTTATDVLGFFIFLGLANLFLPQLAG